MENYAQQDTARMEKILLTSSVDGLTVAEAERRLAAEGKNLLLPDRRPSIGRFLLLALRRTCPYALIALCVLAFVWESMTVAFLMLGASLAFLGALLVLYCYRERGYAAVEAISLPFVTVIRGGKQYTLSPEQLVRGDLLLLRAGDILHCGAHLVTEQPVSVSCERGGKRQTLKKHGGACFEPSGEPYNSLQSGDVILEGSAYAFVTELSRQRILAPREGEGIPPSLGKLCRTVLTLAYVVSGILLLLGFLLAGLGAQGYPLFFYAALITAASPLEWHGLLLDSAFLFKSGKMLKNQSIRIVSPAAAEVLAETDAYLLSTRAILRTDRFRVRSFESGTGFRVTVGSRAESPELTEISRAVLAMYGQDQGELCERHITAFCRDHAIGTEPLRLGTVTASVGEDGSTMASFVSPENGYGFSIVSGDPEFLLSRTMYISEGGRVHVLDQKTREEMLLDIRKMKEDGYQLIAYTETQARIVAGMSAETLSGLKLLGFFVLAAGQDEQIGTALQALYERRKKTVFLHDGIDASWIAEEFPLLDSATLLDGAAPSFEEDILAFAEGAEAVFGIAVRLSPIQQSRLAHVLEDHGHRVAAYGVDFFDHRMVCAASASFAPLPQRDGKNSPVITASASAYTGEKIISQVGCTGGASDILATLKGVAYYLSMSLVLRLVLLTVGAAFDIVLLPPLLSLALGTLADVLACIALSLGEYTSLYAWGHRAAEQATVRLRGLLFGIPAAALATALLGVWVCLGGAVRFAAPALVLCSLAVLWTVMIFSFAGVKHSRATYLFPMVMALCLGLLFRLGSLGHIAGFVFYAEVLFWALIPAVFLLLVGKLASLVMLRKKTRMV